LILFCYRDSFSSRDSMNMSRSNRTLVLLHGEIFIVISSSNCFLHYFHIQRRRREIEMENDRIARFSSVLLFHADARFYGVLDSTKMLDCCVCKSFDSVTWCLIQSQIGRCDLSSKPLSSEFTMSNCRPNFSVMMTALI
jgi:hypothetical protein